jgi:hypothetical protein
VPKSYLVIYRCCLDDLPIGILTDYQDAVDLANEQDADNIPEHIQNILGLDASSPHSVAIITFDESGRPENLEVIQEFV